MFRLGKHNWNYTTFHPNNFYHSIWNRIGWEMVGFPVWVKSFRLREDLRVVHNLQYQRCNKKFEEVHSKCEFWALLYLEEIGNDPGAFGDDIITHSNWGLCIKKLMLKMQSASKWCNKNRCTKLFHYVKWSNSKTHCQWWSDTKNPCKTDESNNQMHMGTQTNSVSKDFIWCLDLL